jgi:hypothetical protein
MEGPGQRTRLTQRVEMYAGMAEQRMLSERGKSLKIAYHLHTMRSFSRMCGQFANVFLCSGVRQFKCFITRHGQSRSARNAWTIRLSNPAAGGTLAAQVVQSQPRIVAAKTDFPRNEAGILESLPRRQSPGGSAMPSLPFGCRDRFRATAIVLVATPDEGPTRHQPHPSWAKSTAASQGTG